MKCAPVRIALASLVLLGAAALAAPVEEKFDDGKPKVKYSVDEQGRKDGLYQEFYATGKPKLRATYKADLLDGKYSVFHEDGRPKSTATYKKGELSGPYTEFDAKGKKALTAVYKDGKLNGKMVLYEKDLPILAQPFQDDQPVYPKSREKIFETFMEIFRGAKNGPDEAAQRDFALRRLKGYRYVCDLPYKNLTLDDQYNRLAQAAAVCCEKLKGISHSPPNPGLPEAEYKLAKAGCGQSNLAAGASLRTTADCVDLFMNDSDASNIARLGHRRWCLNPPMGKTGFGKSGRFAAMYSPDKSNPKVPDFDYVCFPPRGLIPTMSFHPIMAWNFSPNPRKFKRPDAKVKVRIFPLDARFRKAEQPLPLNYQNVDTMTSGLPYCVIFRPEKLQIGDGKRYLVEIEGLTLASGRPAGIVAYPVEFFVLRQPK